MPDLEKRRVYDVSISSSYKVEAKDPDESIRKAKEWVEENAGKLNFAYTELEVWVGGEE